MSQRSAFAITVAALALVIGLIPTTGGGAPSATTVNVVSVTPTTRTTSLSPTKINTLVVRHDLRYEVLVRNSDRVRRQVRVTLTLAQPGPDASSVIAPAVVGASDTKTVTLGVRGPIALGQRLNLTVTVRAGNGATVRRAYSVIFTLG